jgi:transposase
MNGTILAIDLGKFKSVACLYDSSTKEHCFRTIGTTPDELHDLIVELGPDRIVIEVCGIAGWIFDLACCLEVPIEVANPRQEGWRWNKVKRKTDRDDALKLARLSIGGDLPTVHMPDKATRQWRSLITYRHKLVDRRTAIKNTIRALVDVQGLRMASGAQAWSKRSKDQLRELSQPLESCRKDELWRGQLLLELESLEHINGLVQRADAALDALAADSEPVQRLKTVAGLGNRTAEAIVAMLDRPERFRNGRQVGAYAGLVPRQYESGMMKRQGRISKEGPGLLRRLLVQVAWGMERRSRRARALFARLSRGQKTRRKQAAVAVARKLLVWCWAMLRDRTTWREPAMT